MDYRRSFLLHIHILACFKAEIYSAHDKGYTLLLHCAGSVTSQYLHNNILFMNPGRTQLHNINFITCIEAEAHYPKIDSSPAFHKITQA